MLLRSVQYARPESLAEAVGLLAGEENARALAGGQSLINVLKHRAAEVGTLVDVGRLEELSGIDATADGGLEIGAAVTYDRLERDPDVGARHPTVAAVAAGAVDQQVRCRGTIGGNACFNDPGSNFPPLLLALDATMLLAGPSGEREAAAADFFRGPYQVGLDRGELLRAIRLPALGDAGVSYRSLQLSPDSWAIARAVVRLRCNGTIADPTVVLGCVAGSPLRAAAVEESLAGARPDEEEVAAAAALADRGVRPTADVHGGSDYRREMTRVMVKRAVLEAAAAARGGR